MLDLVILPAMHLCMCVYIHVPVCMCVNIATHIHTYCSYFKCYSTKRTYSYQLHSSPQRTSSSGKHSVQWQQPQVALKLWEQTSQPWSNPSEKGENRPEVSHVFVILNAARLEGKSLISSFLSWWNIFSIISHSTCIFDLRENESIQTHLSTWLCAVWRNGFHPSESVLPQLSNKI